MLSSMDAYAWAILLPPGSFPNQNCRSIIAYGRAGNRCCAGYVDPNPPNPSQVGRRIIFPQCGIHGQKITEVQIIFCCP